MRVFLTFLATIAVAAAAGGFSPGLRVRYDVGPTSDRGQTFFYDIPRNVASAKEEGWTLTRRPAALPLPQLVMYCPEDRVLCTLYDDTDYIAGVQVAVTKSEFTDNTFDMTKQGFTSWNTAVNGEGKDFWTLQQYFVDEEFLAIDKEERLASRDPDRLLQVGGIWLTGFNKELFKVPNLETDIVAQGQFTKQACIPLMGLHYYYNMSSTTQCTDDQIFPWFPLVKNGELIATGFMTFGQLQETDGARNWFERPSETAVKMIVPRGPDCLYALAAKPGTLTMHIYYIDHPWTITCQD